MNNYGVLGFTTCLHGRVVVTATAYPSVKDCDGVISVDATYHPSSYASWSYPFNKPLELLFRSGFAWVTNIGRVKVSSSCNKIKKGQEYSRSNSRNPLTTGDETPPVVSWQLKNRSLLVSAEDHLLLLKEKHPSGEMKCTCRAENLDPGPWVCKFERGSWSGWQP